MNGSVLLALFTSLALAPSTIAAQEPCSAAELTGTFAPIVPAGQLSTTLDGDTLFVRDVSASAAPGGSGAIFVFDRDPVDGTWSEIQRLVPPSPATEFGRIVEIDGDRAFVAAVGRIHCYLRDPATRIWTLTQVIDPERNPPFPWNFTVSGDCLAATYGALALPGIPAEVHIHRRDPATGLYEVEDVIGPGTTAYAATYGHAVELLSKDLLAVSNSSEDFGFNRPRGCFRVFRRDPTGTWNEQQLLRGAIQPVPAGYARSMVWDGERLFVEASPDADALAPLGTPVSGFDVYEVFLGALVRTGTVRAGVDGAANLFSPIGSEDSGVAWFIDGDLAAPPATGFEVRVRPWVRDTVLGTWEPGAPLLDGALNSDTRITGQSVGGGRLSYVRITPTAAGEVERRVFVVDLEDACGATGARFCDVQTPNSTGEAATLDVYAPSLTAGGVLSFVARELPASTETVLLASPDTSAPMPLGNAGLLCLGASVGRFPGVMSADGGGVFAAHLRSSMLPSGDQSSGAMAGQTWSFQVWYRDAGAGGSNLTSASSITFR